MSAEIENAIDSENWVQARKLIRARLNKSPDDHWLLTRLGLTFYEQRRYLKALEYSERAKAVAPDCPLVLWDYAGTLEMLDRPADALKVFERIVDRGIESVAFGDCGEGLRWARGLIADCYYRMAHCRKSLGHLQQARRDYEQHLALRGPGCRSIYPISKVRKELAQLTSISA